MNKKRILIAMVLIGNGHKAPAIALQKTINSLYPEKYDVEVIDLFQQMGCMSLYKRYHFTWVNIAMKVPWLLNLVYKWMDRPVFLNLEENFLKELAELTKEYIKKTKPSIIIADHFSVIHVMSMIKKDISVPIIAINTDPYDGHQLWASPNVDNYIVFSNNAKHLLQTKGVDPKKLIVFKNGYPLDPKHSAKIDSKEKIRKKLGLESKQTILMSAGAEAGINLKKYLHAIIENNLNFQIILICGRNEKLKQEIEQIVIPQGCPTSIKVLGFVDNMHEYTQAADLVLGKPGASQTFETLAKNKPIVYSTYLTNEYGTLEFVTKNGLGWYTPRIKDFIQLLKEVQTNQKMLNQASHKIAKRKIKSNTPEIAKMIIKKMENGK